MEVRIGIMRGKDVKYRLNGNFIENRKGSCRRFVPKDEEATFTLERVTIGKEFHWQREEEQTFRGTLILQQDGDEIQVINELPVEQYLESVISSEMSAGASLEFLKAHAVISRSWVMRMIQCSSAVKMAEGGGKGPEDAPQRVHTGEIVRWYDTSQHAGFHVCADDHCQRYQGIGRIRNQRAVEAVRSTAGEVLMYDGEIVDARFSKCCGGAFERFENCWENSPKPYLREGRDLIVSSNSSEHLSSDDKERITDLMNGGIPDLTDEQQAHDWILGNPESFCNTTERGVLSQVMNDYDLETADFYRWRVEYSVEELSEIVRRRSGVDFGKIQELVPLTRGVSGRITRLKIEGSKRSMVIGKELEIRRTLSESHLYSSAFTVEKKVTTVEKKVENVEGGDKSKPETRFILRGAGWGHGVGLCQIGAAMMATKGYTYREILSHYYPATEIHHIIKVNYS